MSAYYRIASNFSTFPRYALATTNKEQAHSRYLGQQGLKGGGVGSLLGYLESPALQSCSVTLQLSRITVYKVLATTLTIFHEDTLGDATSLAKVVSEHTMSHYILGNSIDIIHINKYCKKVQFFKQRSHRYQRY